MLEKNFLFEYAGILGFDIGQSGGNCTLVPFEVVVAHFEFAELDLELLRLLPYCIQFALQRRGCCVVGGLQGHELGLGRGVRHVLLVMKGRRRTFHSSLSVSTRETLTFRSCCAFSVRSISLMSSSSSSLLEV